MIEGAPKVVQIRTWQAHRQRRRMWLALVLIMLGLATALAYQSLLDRPPIVTRTQPPRTQGTGAYEVIDGDTIRAPYGVKYRLMGFDAPETFQAKCDAELTLGKRAAERLKELLASGEVRIVESGKIDRYGRTLAHLTVNGRDVGGVLIGEGLARAYDGRAKRESWCG
jgi:micrococcal nuclease